MAFTKALYYPWIDIKDEGWLKNAMLYWDKIHTIVPRSFESPYKKRAAREFYEEGLLVPYYVHPDMKVVQSLGDNVLRYIESPEGEEVLTGFRKYRREPPLTVKVKELSRIHPSKFSFKIRRALKETDFYSTGRNGNWVLVDKKFGEFYMDLLASQISNEIGAGLLTDKTLHYKLANAVRRDVYRPEWTHRLHREQSPAQKKRKIISLAEGMLADLILQKIEINPQTSVKKILKFREKHSDKLGCFRKEVEKLVSSFPCDLSPKAFHQYTYDIYTNEVKPTIKGLKDGLKDIKIEFLTNNFMKISFFSTSSTSIPLAFLGLSAPYALLAGAGSSLVLSCISYNRKKDKFLRENPFSYLLDTEKALNKEIRLIIKK